MLIAKAKTQSQKADFIVVISNYKNGFWLGNSRIPCALARVEREFEKLKILKISVVLSARSAMGT